MAFLSAQRSVSAPRPLGFPSLLSALGVWRQRRHLAQLDARLRDDIGLSDRQIDAETQRPVWDVPKSWRF